MSEQSDVVDRDEVAGVTVLDQLEQRLDLAADDGDAGSCRTTRRLASDGLPIRHADEGCACIRGLDRPVPGGDDRERDSGGGGAPPAPRDVPLVWSASREQLDGGRLRFVVEPCERLDDEVEAAGGSERAGEKNDVAVCGFAGGLMGREVHGRPEERRPRGEDGVPPSHLAERRHRSNQEEVGVGKSSRLGAARQRLRAREVDREHVISALAAQRPKLGQHRSCGVEHPRGRPLGRGQPSCEVAVEVVGVEDAVRRECLGRCR